MKFKLNLPWWTLFSPLLAWIVFFSKSFFAPGLGVALLTFFLMGSVMAAVHHAEVIAHRVGEPYGTLVLAICITILEVSLIVSLMIAGGQEATTLARDTVFAAIIIILTAMVGICLLIGGIRFKEQNFSSLGVSAALITLVAIVVLTLVLPNYTTSVAGPVYNNSQLIFVAIVSLILYGGFITIQTGRHRDYFLPKQTAALEDDHAAPPRKSTTLVSLLFLIICLGAVVLIAKSLAPTIESGVVKLGAPKSVVGIIVALVILLPEGVAAFRSAKNNRLQNSLNLALGSALASIGLTIPAVAIVSIITGLKVTLGIDAKSILLLALSLITIMLSFGNSKTNILQGIVLLVIFATYLFTTIVP